MSIAAQCPECCTCPTATTEWDSRSGSKTKSGFTELIGFVSTPPKRYFTATGSGIEAKDISSGGSRLVTEAYTGSLTLVPDEIPVFSSKFITLTSCLATGGSYTCASTASSCTSSNYFASSIAGLITNTGNALSATQIGSNVSGFSCPQVLWITLSDEYLTAALIANAIAALPAYDGDWNDTPGSSRNVSTDELSVALRESRYRHRFAIPKIGSGSCYRLEWVERFIAEAGVSLTSAEIVTRGVYRPTVSWSGGGGSGLVLVAVMASDGSVSAIRVLNPGLGFTSEPTIFVEDAINGGTTSTGWVATLTGEFVTSVTRSGGTAGNYLPTGTISGASGSGATITFTLDSTGGLATCPLGSGGSGYTASPSTPVSVAITPKVSGSTAARIDLHLGVETAKNWQWAEGDIPEDYDPDDPSTYPIAGESGNGYFELPVPSADGTTLTANLRWVCYDCEEPSDPLPFI